MAGKIHDHDLQPIELHEQQWVALEHRNNDHQKELEQTYKVCVDEPKKSKVLPVLALNEVFMGEALSARVSYYEIGVDDSTRVKQKSSGVTVCTGTGSTSWFFNINVIDSPSVTEILKIANKKAKCNFPIENRAFVEHVTNSFNASLIYDPSEIKMAYAVRDPVRNLIFQVQDPRGFAKRVVVKSRMWDAKLVIDGSMSYNFNDGTIVNLDMLPEDALRTIDLKK